MRPSWVIVGAPILVLAGLATYSATADQGPSNTTSTAKELARVPRPHTVSQAIPGKDGIKRMVILRGLDKITGQAVNIDAPIGLPVHYATLTITAHWCYSTPPSETPETTAFLSIVDHRPDKPPRQVFSRRSCWPPGVLPGPQAAWRPTSAPEPAWQASLSWLRFCLRALRLPWLEPARQRQALLLLLRWMPRLLDPAR